MVRERGERAYEGDRRGEGRGEEERTNEPHERPMSTAGNRILTEHHREKFASDKTKQFQDFLGELLTFDAKYEQVTEMEQKGVDKSKRRAELNAKFASLNQIIVAYAEKHASRIFSLDLSGFELCDSTLRIDYTVLQSCALLKGLRSLTLAPLPSFFDPSQDTRTVLLLRLLVTCNTELEEVIIRPPDKYTATFVASLTRLPLTVIPAPLPPP